MTRETESISVESVEEFFARAKMQGIAAGLRVAAEIISKHGRIDHEYFEILAKAREVEEGKGEK